MLCHGGCRALWVPLVTGRPWSQAEHSHFPPAFKAAVRALLLAQRRGSVAVKLRAGQPAGPAAVRRAAVRHPHSCLTVIAWTSAKAEA